MSRPRGRLDEPRQVGRVVREVAVDASRTSSAPPPSAPAAKPATYAGPSPPCARGAGRRGSRAPRRAGRRARRCRRARRRRSQARRSSPCSPQNGAERAHHRLEVLALVVRGQADDAPSRHVSSAAGRAAKLPTNTDLAEKLYLLADLLESDGADSFRLLGVPPRRDPDPGVGGARRAARDRRPPPQIPGHRRHDRREDRRAGRDGRSRGAPEGAGAHPGRGSSPSRPFPVSARRRRGRSAGTRRDRPRGPARGGRGPAPARPRRASARRPRSACWRTSRGRPSTVEDGPHAARPGARPCEPLVEELRAHPAAIEGLPRPWLGPPPRRDGEGHRPDRDRHRAGRSRPPRPSPPSPRWLRWPRSARRRRPSSRSTGCASTCASSRRRATATGSTTSPAPRPTTWRCGRTLCGEAFASTSTASPPTRRGEGPHAARGGRLRAPRIRPSSRPSCARTTARWRPRAQGRLPRLIKLGDIKGDLHVIPRDRRTGDARGDGRGRPRKGYQYLAITDHSQRCATGGLRTAQTEAIDAPERAARRDRHPHGHRGRHPRGRLARPADDESWASSTGCASIHSGLNLPPTATKRIDPGDGQPATATSSATPRPAPQQARAVRGRPRADHAGALERGCSLELNAQPDRLDLNGRARRMAKEPGVKRRDLDRRPQRRQCSTPRGAGVDQARRGWLGRETSSTPAPGPRSRRSSRGEPDPASVACNYQGLVACNTWHDGPRRRRTVPGGRRGRG